MKRSIDLEVLADELAEAQERCIAVEPLLSRFPEMTVAQAYQIQMAGIEKRLQTGRRVVGKKIGLTSQAMQNALGVFEPDYGHLLDDMVILNGQPIAAKQMLAPRCEGEIAFLLKRDLTGPGVTVADVLAATEAVMPALEIIDSRIVDWKIKLQDTVADNASSAFVVLGNALTPMQGLDLRLVGLVYEKNGKLLATGSGAAVLGHPASAVAWLANKLADFGVTLRGGEVILSGAIVAAAPVAPGDYFRAEFDRLGSASVCFV